MMQTATKLMMNKVCWITLIVLMFNLHSSPLYAQQIEDHLDIYFRQDVSDIEEEVRDNKSNLKRLSLLFDEIIADSLVNISRIEINSWTSPEPGEKYNKKLSIRRSEAIKAYILGRWDIPDSLLVANGQGVAWDKLRDIVAQSDMQYRDEVLDIIENVPVETWRRINTSDRWLTLVDSRLKQLMDLRDGRAYKYLYDNIFPLLRYGSQVSIFHKETLFHKEALPLAKFEPIEVGLELPTVVLPMFTPEPETYIKPIIALKTNLLYDAVAALNISVEIPIGNRWSIEGEYIFPWWRNESSNFTMQAKIAHFGVSYWFGDRDEHDPLTGWSVGVYGGWGDYDMQIWSENGVQGDLINTGLSIGYSHAIAKNLNLQYQLGFGYMRTEYRNYSMMYGTEYADVKVYEYPWEVKRRSSFGLTQADISLVWVLTKRRTRR